MVAFSRKKNAPTTLNQQPILNESKDSHLQTWPETFQIGSFYHLWQRNIALPVFAYDNFNIRVNTRIALGKNITFGNFHHLGEE